MLSLSEALLVATCALAAVIDHRRGVIPSSLAIGASGVAFVVHASSVVGRPGDSLSHLGAVLLSWAGGAVLTALVPLLLFRQKAIGGGDVKLFAAMGAFLGPLRGLETSLYVFTLGALVGAFTLARRGALGPALEQIAARAFGRLVRLAGGKLEAKAVDQTWMRFGPVIFVGTSVALFMSTRMR